MGDFTTVRMKDIWLCARAGIHLRKIPKGKVSPCRVGASLGQGSAEEKGPKRLCEAFPLSIDGHNVSCVQNCTWCASHFPLYTSLKSFQKLMVALTSSSNRFLSPAPREYLASHLFPSLLSQFPGSDMPVSLTCQRKTQSTGISSPTSAPV